VRVLAIETSTDACSCALWVDAEVAEAYELAPRRHAELVLPMMDSLLAVAGLAPTGLDGVAFGRGPGTFTGVRIACGVAQGVAYALGLPVVPVSSLQALAQGAARERGEPQVLAALDARMQEVYWGGFCPGEDALMRPVLSEAIGPAGAVELPAAGRWLGAGPGWAVHGQTLAARLGERLVAQCPDCHPHARDVAVLGAAALARGEGVAPELALPVYLRDVVARGGLGGAGGF
jgi:tRNA threonylcarbamoyladenosine biosynthesis protein TsaB